MFWALSRDQNIIKIAGEPIFVWRWHSRRTGEFSTRRNGIFSPGIWPLRHIPFDGLTHLPRIHSPYQVAMKRKSVTEAPAAPARL